jgi:hypothetical protein
VPENELSGSSYSSLERRMLRTVFSIAIVYTAQLLVLALKLLF